MRISKSPCRVSNLRANRARSNGLAVTPHRRCEIRCITRAAGASLRELRREKKEARAERKDGRKEAARRGTRARGPYYTRRPPFFFGGFPLSFLLERGERRGRRGPPEKGGPRRGHVSRPGHLPLKRTHCYVPIISFTLAASHLPFSPFVFFLLLPPRLLLRYLLALRLLVSRNKQLPFSLAYKSATYLRTCPSRRMTVNRSRGDHRDVLPGDRREKKKRRGVASPLRRCNRKKRNDRAGMVVKILNRRSLVFITQGKCSI